VTGVTRNYFCTWFELWRVGGLEGEEMTNGKKNVVNVT